MIFRIRIGLFFSEIWTSFSEKKFENFVRCVHQKKKLMMCTCVFLCPICLLKNEKIVYISTLKKSEKNDTKKGIGLKSPKILVQKVIDVYIKKKKIVPMAEIGPIRILFFAIRCVIF